MFFSHKHFKTTRRHNIMCIRVGSPVCRSANYSLPVNYERQKITSTHACLTTCTEFYGKSRRGKTKIEDRPCDFRSNIKQAQYLAFYKGVLTVYIYPLAGFGEVKETTLCGFCAQRFWMKTIAI